MKKQIVKFLKYVLGKFDSFELKQCTIDMNTSFVMSKFIPDDNK